MEGEQWGGGNIRKEGEESRTQMERGRGQEGKGRSVSGPCSSPWGRGGEG